MKAYDNPHGCPDEEQRRHPTGLVLLAEDDAINRKVICHQLASLGMSVDMASDGLEALALWRSGRTTRPHALLLTDLRMPRMDGCTLASSIRSEEPAGARMPIVALSGNALHCDVDSYRRAGMDDFLTKPVRTEQLGDALERWLPSETALSAAPRDPSSPEEPARRDVEADYVYDRFALEHWVGGDATLQTDFRNVFLVSARSTLEDMLRSAERGDGLALGKLARRLQSSAQAVGAASLAACCDAISSERSACSTAEMQRQLARLQAALAHATIRLSGQTD